MSSLYESENVYMSTDNNGNSVCYLWDEIPDGQEDKVTLINDSNTLHECLDSLNVVHNISACPNVTPIVHMDEVMILEEAGYEMQGGIPIPNNLLIPVSGGTHIFTPENIIGKGSFGSVVSYTSDTTDANIALKIAKKPTKRKRKQPPKNANNIDQDQTEHVTTMDPDQTEEMSGEYDHEEVYLGDTEAISDYDNVNYTMDGAHAHTGKFRFTGTEYGDDRDVTVSKYLSHKGVDCGVIPVKYLGEYKNHQFIAMPQLDGSLRDMLSYINKLPSQYKLQILLKIIDHIICLKHYGLYYTDVKLANVLFRCLEGRVVIVLGDIGSIIQLGESPSLSYRTPILILNDNREEYINDIILWGVINMMLIMYGISGKQLSKTRNNQFVQHINENKDAAADFFNSIEPDDKVASEILHAYVSFDNDNIERQGMTIEDLQTHLQEILTVEQKDNGMLRLF